MSLRNLALFVAGFAAVSLGGRSWGADEVDYLREVRPILAARCYRCHSSLKQESSLRLDNAEGLLKGGDSGAAIMPGKSGESRLIEAVVGTGDLKMPPEGERLSEAQIATLRRWIDQGAKMPAGNEPIKHWSLQPVTRPPVPAAPRPERVRNPVDSFLAAARDAQKLQAVVEAPKNVLLRRVYLDLIGLPPTVDELREFAADAAPDALERAVDRLLASPAHGERWGRHWMDVWRYSDWDGYGAEVRESQPHIWRWRDWIIEAVNADKPYNQMIVEMLAGDELAPDDPATLRATGFLVRNWYKFNRNVWIDNTIEHTSKAFLGLTMNCSRCHDHMYDAIQQREYFQLRAIFEPYDIRTDRLPGQADTAKDGLVRAFDAKLDATTVVFTRGDEKQPDKDQPVGPNLPKLLLASGDLKIAAVPLPPAAYYPGSRAYVHEESLAAARAEIAAAEKAIDPARQAVAAARQKLTEFVAANPPKPATPAPAPAAPAPAPPPAPAPAATPAAPPVVTLADDFSKPNPELWTAGKGKFEHQGGHVVQQESLDAQCGLTSQKPHPRDFQAKFRFKITGGKMWRSLGLSFDAHGDSESNFVYVSAFADGPKIQLAHRRNGQDEYPADLAKPLPIELNRVYELTVSVRDHLVNVALDGQLQLVAVLPSRRAEGRVVVWTYDATGEFHSIQVSQLGKDLPLIDKSGAPSTMSPAPVDAPIPPSPEQLLKLQVQQAELAVTLSEATLAAARAGLAAVEARVAADRSGYANPPAANAKDLAVAAVKAEREAALRQAEQKLADAEHKLVAARAALKADDAKTKKAVEDAEKNQAAQAKAKEAAQTALGQLNENYTRFTGVYATSSTGRRLGLAQWIAANSNPLTPRVAVNHIWLRHFGSPLVATVFEFGANGKPPTHPALMDWLARELVEQNWGTKQLHRLLVTSDAYRMSSTGRSGEDPNRAIDPENKFYWRMNSRRMEAEAVRDATLYTAGQLDTRMYGADLDPNAGMSLTRRSVYFRTSKEKKMTFLSLFDSPNVVECYRRSESVAPQQALAMVNSGLTLSQSRILAGTLTRDAGAENKPEQVGSFTQRAFERILCRPPTATELAECAKFLEDQTRRFVEMKTLTAFVGGSDAAVKPSADPHQRARENLVHVLLNHNDFVTIR